MNQPILVSVLCLTYNHRDYIEQCLNSLLKQRTNFMYEILIHDDQSVDGTQNILKKFKLKYPEKIQLYNSSTNSSQLRDFRSILQKFNPKGKYIAFCEGDDYWTDMNKLQIQFDFLETNPTYSFCCHRYIILENDQTNPELAINYYQDGVNLEITRELFFQTWVTQPLTAMLRSKYWDQILSSHSHFQFFRDVHIFYEYLKKGKGISLNRFMGVYRIHHKGIVSGHSILQNLYTTYEIWNELLEANPNDQILKEQYLSVVRRIMLYEKIGIKFKFYINNLMLSSSNLKNFLRLHLYLFKKRPLPTR